MVDYLLRQKLTEWAVGWSNNDDVRDVPELDLFLDQATTRINNDGKTSESLGDYSVSYGTASENSLPAIAERFLGRYRCLRW